MLGINSLRVQPEARAGWLPPQSLGAVEFVLPSTVSWTQGATVTPISRGF